MPEPSSTIDESIKDKLVLENTVKACASVFPTDVWIISPEGNAVATKSCRFVLASHPTEDLWAVLAWASVHGSGNPSMVLASWVESIQRLDSRSIEATLPDGTIVRARPQGGCACGSRLRNWAAWGSNVRLVAVPKPDVKSEMSA